MVEIRFSKKDTFFLVYWGQFKIVCRPVLTQISILHKGLQTALNIKFVMRNNHHCPINFLPQEVIKNLHDNQFRKREWQYDTRRQTSRQTRQTILARLISLFLG